ncbi:MAG: bifunctional UDP-N-acetylglucosamine diphosphorylase/glucosamine-1-phosphate N-acetyltransferase GlmU [Chloroflexi bacterium]|nr:bifunctional UDP-N-acetylglucosamine diphosphorylase/glucosamine-1-phosphate N-acetyltransferase GlmU [Chloroflexota bacterium]
MDGAQYAMTTRTPGTPPLSSPKTTAVTSLAGWTALVLAPGDASHMQSTTPTVLHEVAGVPMVRLVCDLLREAGCDHIVVVAGAPREALAAVVGDGVEIVDAQDAQGSANAALRARASAGSHRNVLILRADMPLISTRTLRELAGRHVGESRVLTFLTAYLTDPHGFGRILRRNGLVQGIVRERDLTGAMRGQPEVNAGLYAADAQWLWETLAGLDPTPSTDSLGDPLAYAVERGGVEAYQVTEAIEVAQVGDRMQLAQADRILRDRVRDRLMRDGVTLMDPPTIYIDARVQVGADTVILPGTHLVGSTSIGSGCRIGPNAILRDMVIGDGCEIGGSTLEGSTLAGGVTVGPYCHVRPGSTLEREVHLGNYAEVKASRIGERTAIGHFSYIGDSDVGADVNWGAGSITANYDGEQKHRTVIGDGVHLGSDTVMVAPVTLGAGARTGAGAVVVDDVPAGATVIGVPARERATGSATVEGGHPA